MATAATAVLDADKGLAGKDDSQATQEVFTGTYFEQLYEPV